ncbi:signal peptidase I [Streptomyces sp. ZAF1911]|uniref:signal peptidase I n=1 Tax=Streptomyces sp. ZAF1911 TaxID=2944129 RepID=UPI00237C1883|nr:signal peptidase I [Streptomyces sp. ZAF1911]MDD9382463.1 signal peptidase I [Streptomyces sp. ZAF1911]
MALIVLSAVLVVGAVLGAGFVFGGRYNYRAAHWPAMEPSHPSGEGVWFERVAPKEIRRGDAVLATAPASWRYDGDVFERVIAVGGDHISWTPGVRTLTLNGKPLVEPYLNDPAKPAAIAFDVTVPEGRVFLMGDNRASTIDSHLMARYGDGGTVPLSAVLGVTTGTPIALPITVAAGILAVPLFLAGGGLGIGSLVARRRATRAAHDAVGSWPEAADG